MSPRPLPLSPSGGCPRSRPTPRRRPTSRQRVALETADIALAGNDLRNVAAVVELSRHTLRVVRQNYTLSIGVNLAGLVAGAGGSINPVLAALLHNTSSIAVVANSARLVGHTPHLPRDSTARLRAAPLEERRVR